ncbi:MAG TPA: hypothetical protein PKM88_12500, partial [bacterium]|nr:hypothetical protein [bacterium]
GLRWRQQLIAANLFLLTTLGLTECNNGPPIGVTCYEVAIMPPPAGETVAALRQQLDLLQASHAAGNLTPDTVAIIATDLENRLWLLRDTAAFNAIDTPARPAAFATRDAAQAALAELRRELVLTGNQHWRDLQAVFAEAKAIIAGSRGSYPFTQSEKAALVDRLRALPEALDRLAAEELLPASAAGLLAAETKELLDGVQRFRPTEMQGATCYMPMRPPVPAQVSSRQLVQRVELLEQLAKEHDLPAALISEVRASIDADLAVLTNHEQLARLPEAEQTTARETARRVQAALDQLKP